MTISHFNVRNSATVLGVTSKSSLSVIVEEINLAQREISLHPCNLRSSVRKTKNQRETKHRDEQVT